MRHSFTQEQREFITENIKGCTRKDLLEMFNNQFGTELRLTQIVAFLKNNKLNSGLEAQFKKGHTPYNKGKSLGGWEPTQFKLGCKPHNYKPIGTERVNGDGYMDIKVTKNKWRGKHLVLWEREHGPIPKGHVVIFGDGNRYNFDMDNLILITRKQLAVMNQKKLIQKDADLTRTGVIVADLYSKINERKKQNKKARL